jgi:hypothetical protein
VLRVLPRPLHELDSEVLLAPMPSSQSAMANQTFERFDQ